MDTTTLMSGWMLWSSFAIIFSTLVSWFVFGRRAARIERAIRNDGKGHPCPWDGFGARISSYAWAIALPVSPLNPLDHLYIDAQLVREYSNTMDRVVAVAMMVSTGLTLLLMIASTYVDLVRK